MKHKIITTLLITFLSITGFSQQIPVGSCGIVYIHDAAGCRTRRVYFCNNGIDPYPTRHVAQLAQGETADFTEVDALYPNPTTGKFSVTFSKELQNATVLVTDLQGKMMVQFKASGNKVDFDLSAAAAGVYFVRIEEKDKIVTKKVVKQ
ncbi:MAG: T9SS type A sorting domain-containing protein [Bacteroidota bacterium]|nr:T9SS type A sorting domain-containing protein [Bacteroidota bacterium]